MNTTTVWCDMKHCKYAKELDGLGLYHCTKEIIGLRNGVCEDYETDKLCINCIKYSELCDESHACMDYVNRTL